MAYFEIDDEEEPGFFGLLTNVWAEADARRQRLIEDNGEDLGRWLADIRQYGAAWWGDAWQPEARRAENHVAFATMGDSNYWDHKPLTTGIMSLHIRFENGQDLSTYASRLAEYSIASGKLVG